MKSAPVGGGFNKPFTLGWLDQVKVAELAARSENAMEGFGGLYDGFEAYRTATGR